MPVTRVLVEAFQSLLGQQATDRADQYCFKLGKQLEGPVVMLSWRLATEAVVEGAR